MNVYFIQARIGRGPIKIGLAEDPEARLNDLQTANATELALLGVIRCGDKAEARALERCLHGVFHEQRTRRSGEWFHPSSRLYSAINMLCGGDSYMPFTAEEAAA